MTARRPSTLATKSSRACLVSPHTRRYLYLTGDVRAFEPVPCGRFVALRLDFAIERAICTWWILSGWEAEDGDAVSQAAERAAAAT